jgi:class 3 adenylate cyclase
VDIAYQVVGDGPIDIVYTSGIFSNLEVMWEWPDWARYLNRLASFSGLVLFDMRGVGLSDRGPRPPLLEEQMEDVGAVMDAVGLKSAVIFGGARGAAMTTMFAATHPERTDALVLYAPIARTLRAPDWPHGRTEVEQEAFLQRFSAEMGTGRNLDLQAPDHPPEFVPWWARFERLTASPGAWREIASILSDIDIRKLLPLIQSPALVIQRSDDRIIAAGQARAIAEAIPNAKLVEVPGRNHLPFLGDHEAIIGPIEEFLTGARSAPESDRVLATVLFTDIARSTETAARLGDERWNDMLHRHRDLVRRQLAVYRGVEVDIAGDGFLIRFDGPARAIACAAAIIHDSAALGLTVRAGIHTGECQLTAGGITGLAVHIAARVVGMAEPGEIVVTSTVRDLVAGSGVSFADRGRHVLKGVPDEWQLLVVRAPGPATSRFSG